MSRRTSVITALALAIGFIRFVAAADAAIVQYYGADTGIGPPGSFPMANSAAALFDTAIGLHPVATFEGVPLGTFGTLNAGSGVTATLVNLDPAFSRITNIDQHAAPSPLGFNITPGGSEWLQVAPFFNDPVDGAVIFSFLTSIQAFGDT